MPRHPNEPGFEDDVPPAGSERAPGPQQQRREYDPKMRPIWTHGADGKPNRKIWIERVDLGDKIAADHKALFGDIDEKIRRTHAARTRIIKRFDHLNLEGLEHLAELLDWLDDEQLDDMFPGLRSRTPQR